MIRRLYTVCLILIFALMGTAQDIMTIEKAITIGLENSFQLKIDDQNIQLADNNNSWAQAGKYPTIDLNGSFNPTVVNDNNPASFLNGVYFVAGLGASVDVNWTLFAGGRVKIAKKQLEKIGDQQRVLKQLSINDLVKNIYQAYQEILLQQERLFVLRESYVLSNNRLEYERVRKEFGSSNAFNISQFEEAILSDSINILNQHNLISISKQNLYNIVNIEPDKEYIFEGVLSVKLEELDKDKIWNALEENNLTLKSLKVIEELLRLNTNIAEASRKPSIAASGTIGLSENYFKFYKDDPTTGAPFPGRFSNRINLGVGASVNWNIYDGGLKKRNVENTKIEEEIGRLDILNAMADLNIQINTLIENYNNQKQILILNGHQLDVVGQNLTMAEVRYKAGTMSSVDYRAIQNQYLNAAFTKTNSIYNLIIIQCEIDWLVGTYGK